MREPLVLFDKHCHYLDKGQAQNEGRRKDMIVHHQVQNNISACKLSGHLKGWSEKYYNILFILTLDR